MNPNDNTNYSNLNRQLNNVVNNINNVVYYLNLINNACSEALIINNNTDYKKNAINNKYSLENQRKRIVNEILPEVRSKM